MNRLHEEAILVAGYGKTGKSISDFLSARYIDFIACDDENHDPCSENIINNSDYVFKSPGLSPDKFSGSSMSYQLINDIEYFMRISCRPVICVTGTNGKSTVVSMLEYALKKTGIHAVACGNNGVPVLQVLQKNYEIYIMELSSYQLENISSLVVDSSVVLNIGIDHMERYESHEDYVCIKKRVYDQSFNKVVPVDENDDICYGNNISGYKSLESGNVYRVGGGFFTRNGKNIIEINQFSLYGKHNYLNVCASIALVDYLDIDKEEFLYTLAIFSGLPHRMEIVCSTQSHGIWINDSKSTNVHATHAALSAINDVCCLIMGGVGKGGSYRDIFVDYQHIISTLIVYGKSTSIIIEDAEKFSDIKIFEVPTVSEAVEIANFLSEKCILFSPACSSFDQYSDFEERGNDFKRCVQDIIYVK